MFDIIMNQVLELALFVLGVFLSILATYYAKVLKPKIDRYFEIKADKDNLGIINDVAKKAVEFAELEFTGQPGKEKLDGAITYALVMLERYGINVSKDFLKGSIQQGWREMENTIKGEDINE